MKATEVRAVMAVLKKGHERKDQCDLKDYFPIIILAPHGIRKINAMGVNILFLMGVTRAHRPPAH